MCICFLFSGLAPTKSPIWKGDGGDKDKWDDDGWTKDGWDDDAWGPDGHKPTMKPTTATPTLYP